MGEFFNIVAPFSTAYDNKIFVFADNTVSAMHLAKMLGFNSRTELPLDFIRKLPTKYPTKGGLPVKYFVQLCDLEEIMKRIGRDPADLRKVFPMEKKLSRTRSEPETPQSSAEVVQVIEIEQKKRDREQEEEEEESADTPEEFIKLFAKRYIKEHPDKAKEYIVEKLIKNKLDDLMKSLA